MTAALAMSEADLQDAVIDLAHLLGYLVGHFRPARVGHDDDQRWVTPVAADGKGFPDLVLAGPRGVIAAELKSATGRVSDDQDAWLHAMRAGGLPAFLWRPSHWHDGTIERALMTGGNP